MAMTHRSMRNHETSSCCPTRQLPDILPEHIIFKLKDIAQLRLRLQSPQDVVDTRADPEPANFPRFPRAFKKFNQFIRRTIVNHVSVQQKEIHIIGAELAQTRIKSAARIVHTESPAPRQSLRPCLHQFSRRWQQS